MSFCTNCGAQLPDGIVFCPNCGTRILNQANPAPNPGQQSQAGYGQNPAGYGQNPAYQAQPNYYNQQPCAAGPVQNPGPVYRAPASGGTARMAAAVGTAVASKAKTKVIAWVLVVLLVVGGTLGTMAALGVFKSDETKIRDTISDFQEAYNTGDMEGLEECFCRSMRVKISSVTGLLGAGLSGLTGYGFDIGDLFGLAGGITTMDIHIDTVQINGDRAYAIGTMEFDTSRFGGSKQSTPVAFSMVKEGGDWLIENFTEEVEQGYAS